MSIAELLLIFFVALCVFGPGKLPMLARHLAIAVNHINRVKAKAHELLEEEMKHIQLEENEKKASVADNQYQGKHD